MTLLDTQDAIVKSKIDLKVNKIYNVLTQNIESINDFGVLGGLPGVLIFIQYYQKINKLDSVDIDHYLNLILDDIGDRKHNWSFGTGLSGIFWTINHLNGNDIFYCYDFEEINDLIFKYVSKQLEYNKNDYLHQGLGGVLCLIENGRVEEIQKIVELLYEYRVSDRTFKIWFDGLHLDYHGEKRFNLGISHGVSGIILILIILRREKVEKQYLDLIDEMITDAAKWLINRKNKLLDTFPNWVKPLEDEVLNKKSRLAWCYGDLGVGYSLIKAGMTLENKEILKEGLDTCLDTCKRQGIEEASIYDAGLCHGTAGVAHIYNKLFYLTGNFKFRTSSTYWVKKTLEFGTHNDGYAGFKIWNPVRNQWELEYGFLEGISGIGLALISFLYPDLMSWDRILLFD